MLVFYDEPPDRLYACVTSALRLADFVVAADGPFADFPHERARTQPAAIDALRAAGGDALSLIEGSELASGLIEPRPWAGQVAKRQAVMTAAEFQRAEWVFPIDSDELLMEVDRVAVNDELAITKADTLLVPRYTPENDDARWEPRSTSWERPGEVETYPRLFRVYPEMKVGPSHAVYSGIKGEERVCLWGPHDGAPWPMAPADELRSTLRFHHFQTWRSDDYRAKMDTYSALRTEAWSETGRED